MKNKTTELDFAVYLTQPSQPPCWQVRAVFVITSGSFSEIVSQYKVLENKNQLKKHWFWFYGVNDTQGWEFALSHKIAHIKERL